MRKVCAAVLALLFCLTMFLCLDIALRIKQAVHPGMYILTVKNGTFSADSTARLMEQGVYFTYVATRTTQVSTGLISESADITVTNENYADIARLGIVYGTFFNEAHIRASDAVVVMNRHAAWQFFGTLDCVGNTVRIDNKRYTVIGVAADNTEDVILYLPLTSTSDVPLSEVWVNADNLAECGLLTVIMGVPDAQIFQMERYKELVMFRVRLLLLMAGLTLIVIGGRRVLRIARKAAGEVKDFAKNYYLPDIKRLFHKEFIIALAVTVLYAGVTLLLLRVTLVGLYVPPDIPETSGLSLGAVGKVLGFYVQPHVDSPALAYMNDVNLVSVIAFFSAILSFVGVFGVMWYLYKVRSDSE